MRVARLDLTNFRNYARLGLDLPPGVSVFRGDNAQGKTNLLEALFFLATTRSPRSAADRDLVRWGAAADEMPVCRVSARVQKASRPLHIEIAMRAPSDSPRTQVRKHIRVDGAGCRASDLVGQVNVSLFTAQDIDLVQGEPALRRRYLDILDSQVDRRYLRALQHYQRVLSQRNHLLRLIGEKRASADELTFWDRELVRFGTYLTLRRKRTVDALAPLVGDLHAGLSGSRAPLALAYRPGTGDMEGKGDAEVAETFRQALATSRPRELRQGMTVIGPHRDDLVFLLEGRDMGVFGSRGQQRIIVVSLKLAEARFLAATTREQPIVLLDDVLSELDVAHRDHVLSATRGYEQVLITTTDLDLFSPRYLEGAALFSVAGGRVEPLTESR